MLIIGVLWIGVSNLRLKAVSESLRGAITDYGLEEVVRRLASASGARATLLPKNTSLPGDADVLATYDLHIGLAGATVDVAYQVKQHDGTTDERGVRQLIERMEASPNVVRGCLVTTARDVTAAARQLADKHNILVLAEKDLVEWVLSVGLSALTE